MTLRPFVLAFVLTGICIVQIKTVHAQDISSVKEWSGTVTVTESGTLSSSAQNDTRSTEGMLSVERSCSGTVHLTEGDGYGYWSGEAQLSCSISGAFEHKVDNSNPRHEVHHVNTVKKQGGENVLVDAELSIDVERKTYSFDVNTPSLEITESQTFSDGTTSSSSSSTSSEYVFELSQQLVEDQPLSGTSLSGSVDEPALYFLPVGNEPSGGVQRTITWSLAPGRREQESDVRVAIDGPSCGCMNAEDAEGAPLFFTGTASEPGGTFSAFEVRSEGDAPREITNEGGSTPRLELAAAPETGRVTLSISYTVDGDSYSATDFSVSFCAMDSISFAAGTDAFSFDDAFPGRLSVDASGQAWINGKQASDKLVWTLEGMGQGVTRVPEEDTGASTRLAYEGLPEWNGAFGEKAITARIEQDGCSCERTKTIRIFYPPFASNHPHAGDGPGTPYGDTPNWFYYWTQSAAQQEIGMRHVRYVKQIVDREGRVVAAQYDETEDQISLTDAVLESPCQSRIDRTTRAPTGETSYGIDCFAETLRHEWQHRADWLEWWPSGAPGLWSGLVVDTDVDFVPKSLENKLPGCSDSEARSCDDLPPIDGITDREINAYWAGWSWPIGSADEEDWSRDGKQWNGGTCPD